MHLRTQILTSHSQAFTAELTACPASKAETLPPRSTRISPAIQSFTPEVWLQPFRLVNVYKKVKISGKATGTKLGQKLGEVGCRLNVCRAVLSASPVI